MSDDKKAQILKEVMAANAGKVVMDQGPVVEKVELSSGNSGKPDIASKVKKAILKKKSSQKKTSSSVKKTSTQIKGVRQPKSSAPSPAVKTRTSGIVDKIEKTVESLADTNSTMETLNKNMSQFINLIKKRSSIGGGQSSGFGGGGMMSQSSDEMDGIEGMSGSTIGSDGIGAAGSDDLQGGNEAGGNGAGGNAYGSMLGGNALMSVLVGNMLKNKDEREVPLSVVKKESPAYIEALTGRLHKYQKEYELLQFLFTKKKPYPNTPNLTSDSNGNAAWLAGFMSMMMNKK